MHVCAATLAIFWDSGMLVSKIDECIIGDGFDCYRCGVRAGLSLYHWTAQHSISQSVKDSVKDSVLYVIKYKLTSQWLSQKPVEFL